MRDGKSGREAVVPERVAPAARRPDALARANATARTSSRGAGGAPAPPGPTWAVASASSGREVFRREGGVRKHRVLLWVVTDATASLPRGGATVAVAEFALRTRTW